MKNFKEKYKNYFNEINISNEEVRTIKNNIIDNKTEKRKNKLSYLYVTMILLLLSGIATTSAIVYSNKINIKTNDKNHKEVEFYAKIEENVNSNILVENEYYTKEDISNLLGLNILQNKKIDSSLFQLSKIEKEDNKVSRIIFNVVNGDKSEILPSKPSFSVEINTKYSKENSSMFFSGASNLEKYYIKSLNTEAIIISTGGITNNHEYGLFLINFVYDDILYNVSMQKEITSLEECYEILESFF